MFPEFFESFSEFFCCSLPLLFLVIPGDVVGTCTGTVGAGAGAVGAPILSAVDVPGFDPFLLYVEGWSILGQKLAAGVLSVPVPALSAP